MSTISSSSAFMERLILLSFVFNTFALTFCPSFNTSDGFLIRFSQICEMCTSPLNPLPRLINAPYGIKDSTVPSITVPGTIMEILWLRSSIAASFATRFADNTSFSFSGSTVMTFASTSFPIHSSVFST